MVPLRLGIESWACVTVTPAPRIANAKIKRLIAFLPFIIPIVKSFLDLRRESPYTVQATVNKIAAHQASKQRATSRQFSASRSDVSRHHPPFSQAEIATRPRPVTGPQTVSTQPSNKLSIRPPESRTPDRLTKSQGRSDRNRTLTRKPNAFRPLGFF